MKKNIIDEQVKKMDKAADVAYNEVIKAVKGAFKQNGENLSDKWIVDMSCDIVDSFSRTVFDAGVQFIINYQMKNKIVFNEKD